MANKVSKTQTSFYRRLYVTHLIDLGINTVPAIMSATKMPRRTAQDTLAAIPDLTIELANDNGRFTVMSWGAINKQWIVNNLQHVKDVLVYR
jgi:hypothetical protein